MVTPLSERIPLRINIGWTFVGNLIYAASQWGVLALLAKLSSADQSATQVGKYSLGLAIATPTLALTRLHLHQVQVTDARGDYQFAHYLSTRVLTSLAALLIITGIALSGPFDASQAWVIFWVGLARCVDAVSELTRGLFQRHERMELSSISLVLKGIAALIVVGGVFAATHNIVLATSGLALVWLLSLLLYDFPNARHLLHRAAGSSAWLTLDGARIGRLIRLAAPLGIGMFLLELQSSLPRYALEYFSGAAQLGYFAAMGYVATIGSMVISAVALAAAPRLADYWATNPAAFWNLFFKLIKIAGGLGIGYILLTLVAGRPILTLLYRPEYAQFQTDFVLLAISGAMTFLAFLGGIVLTATREFRAQLYAGLAACLVSGLGSAILIPPLGLRGATLGAILTWATITVFYFGSLRLIWMRRVRAESAANHSSRR